MGTLQRPNDQGFSASCAGCCRPLAHTIGPAAKDMLCSDCSASSRARMKRYWQLLKDAESRLLRQRRMQDVAKSLADAEALRAATGTSSVTRLGRKGSKDKSDALKSPRLRDGSRTNSRTNSRTGSKSESPVKKTESQARC